ncbi:MAG: hypothetical protein ACRDRJ_46625 [Streptosporangiaceae bacterium]
MLTFRIPPAWSVHRERLAWLAGAGTSTAAGIPTVGQIVDDLLTRLYASAFGIVRQKTDISDPAVMARIRSYYDRQNGMHSGGRPLGLLGRSVTRRLGLAGVLVASGR